MNTKIAARSTEQKPAAPARPLAATIKRITTDSSAIIAVTTVLLFILACIFVNEFATVTNLRALFLSVALVGIAAVGLSIITIVGRLFALSVSAMVAVSTIVFASLLHTGPWTAMAAAVLFGALAGAVQGFFVGRLGTDPIVTTIAAAAILIGIAQIVTGGRNVQGAGDASVFGQTIFGVMPVQVLAFFVLTVLAWWMHRYTVLGRRVTLVGLNEKAALVSGMRAWPVVLFAFIASGAMAGLAGGLLSSESGQGNLQLGGTFRLRCHHSCRRRRRQRQRRNRQSRRGRNRGRPRRPARQRTGPARAQLRSPAHLQGRPRPAGRRSNRHRIQPSIRKKALIP